ncbi:hypothetical protein SDC9_161453 [bioreactor metagenome]|uniref:Transcription regulator AsnC/Lrp ligand binding domain-containing protein n=1 Tax=bioreactor metagenome TaxID=1076179 RepID=A0A645FID4_9ZZZZ
MVTGIVLVNVERPKIQQTIDSLLKLPGVSEVYTVAGEYDLVVMIRVKSNCELSDIVANRMTHDIPGIVHTRTLVTLDVKSHVDIAKLFGLS